MRLKNPPVCVCKSENDKKVYSDLLNKAKLRALLENGILEWPSFKYIAVSADYNGVKVDFFDPQLFEFLKTQNIGYWPQYDDAMSDVVNGYTMYLDLMIKHGMLDEALDYDTGVDWEAKCDELVEAMEQSAAVDNIEDDDSIPVGQSATAESTFEDRVRFVIEEDTNNKVPRFIDQLYSGTAHPKESDDTRKIINTGNAVELDSSTYAKNVYKMITDEQILSDWKRFLKNEVD